MALLAFCKGCDSEKSIVLTYKIGDPDCQRLFASLRRGVFDVPCPLLEIRTHAHTCYDSVAVMFTSNRDPRRQKRGQDGLRGREMSGFRSGPTKANSYSLELASRARVISGATSISPDIIIWVGCSSILASDCSEGRERKSF
jgi:hypothetical protein